MAQILTFFGWLLVGVGLTLFVFGHLSMAFVYDWNYVLQALFPSDDSISSLLIFPLAIAPGAIMYGLGRLLEKFTAKDEAEDHGDGPAPTGSGHDPKKAVLVKNTPLQGRAAEAPED